MRLRRWWAGAAAVVLLGSLSAGAAAPVAQQPAPAGVIVVQPPTDAERQPGPGDGGPDLAGAGQWISPLLLATFGIGIGLFGAGLAGTIVRRRQTQQP